MLNLSLKSKITMKITPFFCRYGDETRAALLEAPGTPSQQPSSLNSFDKDGQWKIKEMSLERLDMSSLVGNIYKGTVVNVVPALEAAFVDIGLTRNGFLHEKELLPGQKLKNLKPGDQVTVQIIRDPIKTKGCRLSQNISLAGRFLVWMPFAAGLNISRKISDKSRERIKGMLKDDDLGGGVIIRTAGEDRSREDLLREAAYLQATWKVISKKDSSVGCVYYEYPLPIKWLREIRGGELDTVLCDTQETKALVETFLERVSPEDAQRVKLAPAHLWQECGAQKAWDSLFKKQVHSEGISLVIEATEAMTVIDVNSGSYTSGKNLQKNIVETNLKAAEEIAHQIRLRDVGGLIVIDFIDMENQSDREKVFNKLEEAMQRDRAKWMLCPVSPLGLVEMSRQNLSASVKDLVAEPCEHCLGEGSQIRASSQAREFWHRLKFHPPGGPWVYVQAPEDVIEWLSHDSYRKLKQIENECNRKIMLGLGTDVNIQDWGSKEKIIHLASPVHVGEEILVKPTEPHMYHQQDAVAKLGDYPVVIRGAIEALGIGQLVVIKEIKPAHAVAYPVPKASENFISQIEREQN